MKEETKEELCVRCGHPLDPHVLAALDPDDLPAGGVMLCPACPCKATWSVQGWPHPEMPPDDEIRYLRLRLGIAGN